MTKASVYQASNLGNDAAFGYANGAPVTECAVNQSWPELAVPRAEPVVLVQYALFEIGLKKGRKFLRWTNYTAELTIAGPVLKAIANPLETDSLQCPRDALWPEAERLSGAAGMWKDLAP